MRSAIPALVLLAAAGVFAGPPAASTGYPITAVPLADVRVTNGF